MKQQILLKIINKKTTIQIPKYRYSKLDKIDQNPGFWYPGIPVLDSLTRRDECFPRIN